MGTKFENLGAQGIVDYDVNAYVYGGAKKPAHRNEDNNLPFDKPLMASPEVPVLVPGAKMHQQPTHDQFKREKSMTPGQALTAIIVAGLGILGIMKFGPKIKDLFSRTGKNLQKKIKNGKKATKKAAKKAKAATKTTKATKGAKATKTGLMSKLSKLPKWAKVTGWCAAGVLALVGISKVFSKKEHKQH